MVNHSALRHRRVELGLTQTELAAAAHVSRQLVVAVEAGVNTPAVDAALRLAEALECTAEDLFDRQPPMPRNARSCASASGPLIVAGCDPALNLTETMLGLRGAAAVLSLDATTGTALRSLRNGGVHAAVVHGRSGQLKRAPVDVMRLQLAHWQVGLGLAAQLRARTLAACLEQQVPIVQRQESAASQQALRRAATALGFELPAGTVASGHLDAARAAAGIGCAAITTEGGALMFGLRFIPLELHTVEIWVDRRWASHPGLDALGGVLTSGVFHEQVSRLGGYDLAGCGSQLGG